MIAGPRVSLVIPAYNAAEYVGAAIDSVLGQSYANLELLVLDDGSTDATRDVLAGYGERIRWDSHPNEGQAATLNRGWAASSGELLGYLSADDVLLPTAVERVVGALQADPGLCLVYPDFRLLDTAGRPLRRVRAPEYDYRRIVTAWECPPGPGALFRRSAASAAGPWDPGLRLTPDYDFWLRLGLHGRGRRLPEVLAGFRVHAASQSFRPVPPARSEEYPLVTDRYFATCPVPPELRAARRQAMSSAHLFAARSHLRSGRSRAGLAHYATAVRLHPPSARYSRVLLHGVAAPLRYRRAAAAR